MYIYTYNLQDALINTFHDSSFSPCSIGIQIWAIDSPIGDPLCAFLPDGVSRYKPLSLIGACLTSEVDIVHSSTLLSIFTGIDAVYRLPVYGRTEEAVLLVFLSGQFRLHKHLRARSRRGRHFHRRGRHYIVIIPGPRIQFWLRLTIQNGLKFYQDSK